MAPLHLITWVVVVGGAGSVLAAARPTWGGGGGGSLFRVLVCLLLALFRVSLGLGGWWWRLGGVGSPCLVACVVPWALAAWARARPRSCRCIFLLSPPPLARFLLRAWAPPCPFVCGGCLWGMFCFLRGGGGFFRARLVRSVRVAAGGGGGGGGALAGRARRAVCFIGGQLGCVCAVVVVETQRQGGRA